MYSLNALIQTVMNKHLSMIYLMALWLVNFSCAEKSVPGKASGQRILVSTPIADTLRFTSSIRAILQDSKGNFWFGSHQEGVCLFDGKSFEYFTTKEGLPDNQIRSLEEDADGNIWFGTANGVCSYKDKKSQRILCPITPQTNGPKQKTTFGSAPESKEEFTDMTV